MGRIVDSNVLLDMVTADPKWLDWSTRQFRAAAQEDQVFINPIIYAELAPAFDSATALKLAAPRPEYGRNECRFQ
ncbi:MAG TPA: hypothetical protein EYQ50_15495 [Verrucomicrobiales bacterium]|nr:hypothetical protein [Verrucomicrobiales bacterium]